MERLLDVILRGSRHERSEAMARNEPVSELQQQFSSDDATPTAWAEARAHLEQAAIFWLTTVRPDGRPHVTPLLSVWLDGALYFCTGPSERKAKNLARNAHCILTTGCNALDVGLDLVVEGDAVAVSGEAMLQRVADLYASKYDGWHFTVRDGAFHGDGGRALVYAVAPTTVFGFGKGTFSQTRWRF
jgi:nitroimidazol reductase NimA-like FMN-containing flavoprotein (pyridoxamine 5'-phosphate oxidase superfamily)